MANGMTDKTLGAEPLAAAALGLGTTADATKAVTRGLWHFDDNLRDRIPAANEPLACVPASATELARAATKGAKRRVRASKFRDYDRCHCFAAGNVC